MARRSVRLLASIAAVATMVTTFAACGNKQATTDENGSQSSTFWFVAT